MTLANATRVGDEVVFVGAAHRSGGHSTTGTAVALAYETATDAWRVLPEPPLSPQSSDIVEAAGRDRSRGTTAGTRLSGFRPRTVGEGWGSRWSHGECYVSGVAAGASVLAWNCGYPDAWYPEVGWRDVEGAPAGDVPVAGAVDRDVGLGGGGRNRGDRRAGRHPRARRARHDGQRDAPAHLWAWRPPEDPPPRVVTAGDAREVVARFLSAWYPGYEPYLPTFA